MEVQLQVHSSCFMCHTRQVFPKDDRNDCQVCEKDAGKLRSTSFCQKCLKKPEIRSALEDALASITGGEKSSKTKLKSLLGSDGSLKLYACQRVNGCWNKLRRFHLLTKHRDSQAAAVRTPSAAAKSLDHEALASLRSPVPVVTNKRKLSSDAGVTNGSSGGSSSSHQKQARIESPGSNWLQPTFNTDVFGMSRTKAEMYPVGGTSMGMAYGWAGMSPFTNPSGIYPGSSNSAGFWDVYSQQRPPFPLHVPAQDVTFNNFHSAAGGARLPIFSTLSNNQQPLMVQNQLGFMQQVPSSYGQRQVAALPGQNMRGTTGLSCTPVSRPGNDGDFKRK